jgi:cobyrinic acid a,c-diamide synthase
MEEMHLTMRHLGLVPYREGSVHGDFRARIATITERISTYVNLDLLQSLMKDVPQTSKKRTVFDKKPATDVRIGVALDEAFNFYYADLFDILPALGADVVPFSPIHDRLPDADGFIFGGGYPELFVRELEENERMREDVREVSENGIPVYAECGGLMYLTERMALEKGWQGAKSDSSFQMCGVFHGETKMPAQRVVSYVEGKSGAGSPMGTARFRGHEFHYSDVVLDKKTRYAYCLSRGIGIRDNLDGAVTNRTLGSYTHLHPVASMGMIRHFIDQCRKKC